MKIAYLSRGNSVWDRRLLEKMVERGHKPYFISYFQCKRVNIEGVENYHYDYNTMHKFPRVKSLQTALHLRRLLKRIRPDVLHTGWVTDMGFLGALCGFKPVLSMPFGSDILLKPYESVIYKLITLFTLKRADMIYCDCEMVKKKIIELSACFPEKIVVFPCGINLNIFKPMNKLSKIREILEWKDKKVLIMARHFMPVYGIEYFIEALPTIIQKEPDVRVIFIGGSDLVCRPLQFSCSEDSEVHRKDSISLHHTGNIDEDYREKCQQRIVELGVDEHVHFTGTVDDYYMAEYLNAADIYVSVSLSDGTSISMLEAMACGLPMVVTDVPSISEWVKDGINGYIVPRKDINHLTEKIINLLENHGLRKMMGECNLQIVSERADWEKNFSAIEDIYKKLANAY